MDFRQSLEVPNGYHTIQIIYSAPENNITDCFGSVENIFDKFPNGIVIGVHIIPYSKGSVNGTNPSQFVLYGTLCDENN